MVLDGCLCTVTLIWRKELGQLWGLLPLAPSSPTHLSHPALCCLHGALWVSVSTAQHSQL